MAMQFNPHTAFLRGMDLGSPTTSQGGINNLLNMQQQSIGDIIGAIGNIGKTSRTNTVNDLIARGGLEGLNEAQTQARIQKEAGGTLTQEGQQNVDRLLQTVGKEDQRKFTTAERLGGEQFTSGENATKAEALFKQNEAVAKAKKEQDDREYAFNVEKFGKEYAEKVRSNKRSEELTGRGQYKPVQGADGMWYNATPEGKLTPLVKGILPYGGKGGSGSDGEDSRKLTGYTNDFWKQSSDDVKQSIELFDSTGKFNTKMMPRKNKDGTETKVYQMQFYGQPIYSHEMVKFANTGVLPARFDRVIPKEDRNRLFGK